MADIFSQETRSRIMAGIKGKNTRPEREICNLLTRMRYKFRLHDSELPGCPDIVLPRHKKAIFVHGCFWHGHRNCKRAARPKTNSTFWNRKIEGNIRRDQLKRNELANLGWKSLVIWGCSIKEPRGVIKRLKRFLSKDMN